jgi:ribosomal protein L37E
MNNVKCPQCGLVNYSFEDQCKRCGLGLAKSSEPVQVMAPQRVRQSKDCPQCESPETRSFEMAYASSTGTGTLVAGSYNFNIGATVTSGSLTQQSALASYVRPPAPPQGGSGTILMILLGVFLGFALMIFMASANYPAFGFLLLVACPLGLGIPSSRHFSRGYAEKRQEYDMAVAQWRRWWICLRCGHRWAL